MKLYEYFLQGKPVVATDMAELRDWADLIYLAEGPAQFAERLDTARGGVQQPRVARETHGIRAS